MRNGRILYFLVGIFIALLYLEVLKLLVLMQVKVVVFVGETSCRGVRVDRTGGRCT